MNTKKTPDINQNYEGFILNREAVEIGDIILERGYSPHSSLIAKKTNSHYSHAMIKVDGTIIEATRQGGVYSRVPNRFYVKNINDLKVLRLKEPLSKERERKLISFSRSLTGSVYSIREAILAGFDKKPDYILTRGQFCSRLVAQAYHNAGISIVENYNFCSPGDIERSDCFYEVKDAVRRGTISEIKHAMTNGSHVRHQKSAVKWTRASKSILLKSGVTNIILEGEITSIETTNDILTAIYQNKDNYEIDEKIARAMHDSGYMDGPYDDEIENPFRYDLKKFIETFNEIPSESRIDALMEEFKKEFSCMNLRLENLDASYQTYFPNKSIKTFKNILIINYLMLKKMLERLSVLLDYCDNKNIKLDFLSELKKDHSQLTTSLKQVEALL
ncbi:hypothetical protein D3C73_161430 [compost metagenome]